MKLSERIGYCFEHLLLLELEDRGIHCERSERPGNDTIKSDITFSLQGNKFVVFATHTRTQGMTNRKFYRTFAELAERRLHDPNAICIEISLTLTPGNVPTQYGLLFKAMFDGSLYVLPASEESNFVEFVKSLPVRLNKTVTSVARTRMSRSISAFFSSAADKIISVRQIGSSRITSAFWGLEQRVSPGKISYSPNAGVSVKLGMKQLTLLGNQSLTLNDLGRSSIAARPGVDFSYLETAGIGKLQRTIGGTRFLPNANVRAAAEACSRIGISLEPGWFDEYLTSPGAKRLHSDLVSPQQTEARFSALSAKLQNLASITDLERLFISDFRSDDERCDFVDIALRASGLSQNQISVRVTAAMGVTIRQRNPIWFIIAKDEGVEDVVADPEAFLKVAAREVWSELEGGSQAVDWKDFYAARLQTYFAHRSVEPQLALLGSPTRGGKRHRQSVLPRIAGLPAKYRMSVTSSQYRDDLFMVDVSTPDPQHHKHKEFAGKIRAIRYELNDQGRLQQFSGRFVIVIDGNWNESQITMLSNAGWDVFDWDSFVGSIN